MTNESNVTAKVVITREEKQFKEIDFDPEDYQSLVGKYVSYDSWGKKLITSAARNDGFIYIYIDNAEFGTLYLSLFNQKHFKFFEEIPSKEEKTVVLEMPLDIAEKIKDKLGQTVYTEDTQVVYQALKEVIQQERGKEFLGIKA